MAYANKEDQRAASRRHYEANSTAMKERAKKHTSAARQRISNFLRSVKDVPCKDCGQRYPHYVMQFDHVTGEKLFNVGDFRRTYRSMAAVEAEVAKCEVVCANCHAERTFGGEW